MDEWCYWEEGAVYIYCIMTNVRPSFVCCSGRVGSLCLWMNVDVATSGCYVLLLCNHCWLIEVIALSSPLSHSSLLHSSHSYDARWYTVSPSSSLIHQTTDLCWARAQCSTQKTLTHHPLSTSYGSFYLIYGVNWLTHTWKIALWTCTCFMRSGVLVWVLCLRWDRWNSYLTAVPRHRAKCNDFSHLSHVPTYTMFNFWQ